MRGRRLWRRPRRLALGDRPAACHMGRPTAAPAAGPSEGRPAGTDVAAERADAPAAAESPGGSSAPPGASLLPPAGLPGGSTGGGGGGGGGDASPGGRAFGVSSPLPALPNARAGPLATLASPFPFPAPTSASLAGHSQDSALPSCLWEKEGKNHNRAPTPTPQCHRHCGCGCTPGFRLL
ncbi:proline-rich protein 29 isoform X2 [Halichoerus grypus]